MIGKFDLIHFQILHDLQGSFNCYLNLFTLCKKAALSSNANMEAPLHGGHTGYQRFNQFLLHFFQIDFKVMTSAARTIIEATEDWGPGPPPFRVPPPPLPPFMLPDDLEDHQEFCQSTLKPSLDSHLDVCDTTFVSHIINLLKTAYSRKKFNPSY